jgi:hypothetical protein
MAKCVADCLLANNLELNPVDLRMRFMYWWNKGYCNGSGTTKNASFGLGGNISESF